MQQQAGCVRAGFINLLLMSNKRKQYYNTPLNISQTIDLPSNLLRARHSYKLTRQPATAPHNTDHLPLESSLKEHIEPITAKKSEKVMMIEEKNKAKHNVLYKRLSDIKGQNEELEKYSYSKLLSKMVVVDPREQYKSVDLENERLRAASEYSCLRGKLMNMDCQEESQRPQSRERFGSRCSDYSSRTTRIFKRYYMPSSEKNAPFFHQPAPEQKYIYINGKKTECKRIHNFYTSQNFRNSYDRAFGKTRDGPYERKERYLGDF